MTIENDTPQGGGGATVPAAEVVQQPAPKSDAEAALQAQAAPPQPNAEAEAAEKAAKEAEGERKKNRTREYINRINAEKRELQERLAAYEAGQARQPQVTAQLTRQAPASDEPTLEQHNFDVEAFTRAHNRWAIEQDQKTREERSRQEATTQRQREIQNGYEEKVAAFADEHPDFMEAVGSMRIPLSMEVQLAIMAHENGPAIAYHIANNDDDAFFMASTQPHLAAAAVERLASRITAAPPEVPSTPAAIQAPQAKPKPISQAPAPTPTVSGRAPTETPPEKLTDDQWYARDREKRRKR